MKIKREKKAKRRVQKWKIVIMLRSSMATTNHFHYVDRANHFGWILEASSFTKMNNISIKGIKWVAAAALALAVTVIAAYFQMLKTYANFQMIQWLRINRKVKCSSQSEIINEEPAANTFQIRSLRVQYISNSFAKSNEFRYIDKNEGKKRRRRRSKINQ